MDNLIRDFRKYLVSGNKSKKTIETYVVDVQNFKDFNSEHGLENEWALEIKQPTIMSYVNHLTEKGFASASIRKKISALGTFYKLPFFYKSEADKPFVWSTYAEITKVFTKANT